MKTIVIPTDFSPVAINAMNYALDMAIQVNAEVILFHVYSVPISMTEVPVMLISVEELEKNAENQIRAMKEKVEHLTSGKVNVRTETRLGDTVDELENICENVKPFAVVMGSRGGSGVDRLFGSTTLSAIRRLHCPVICVPPGKEYGQGIRRIGFACDFRDVVETTPFGHIRDWVRQFSAELHILNVGHREKQEGSKQYELLNNGLKEVNPIYHFIESDDVEEGINDFAEKNNLDLVVTIPKKHKLMEGIFKKSSTRQLVLHAHVPILCIHEE